MSGSWERKPQTCTTAPGQTLIAILVVLVIMMLGYTLFLGPRRMKDGTVKSAPKAALDKASDFECQQYLSQVRQGIAMYGSGDGTEKPGSLADLGKAMAPVTRCPVGGEPYGYDPATGRAWCPHPGHERF